jgi:hypothetical protein
MNFLDSLNKLRDKITPTKKGHKTLNDINIVEEESSEEDSVSFEVTDNNTKKRYGLRPQTKVNYKDPNFGIKDYKMDEELKKLRNKLKSEQKYRQTIERESQVHKNLIADQEKEWFRRELK